MVGIWKTFFFFNAVLFLVQVADCNVLVSNSHETKLATYLLTGYNKDIRPTLSWSSPTEVDLSLILARIESLDEKQQVLTSFGWIYTTWKDDLLRWNPASYGGVFRTVIPSQRIWIPEITLLNSVDQGNDLAFDSKFRATILYNGEVVWAPGFKLRTWCKVDLTYFPFDSQTCEIHFVNWMHQEQLLTFFVSNTSVQLGVYDKNGEWDLMKSTGFVNKGLKNYSLTSHVPVATFRLTLRRKPRYYLLNVITPVVIMTCMTILGFLVPCEAGEKVSLGISVLLSFSVLLLLVSDNMPKSSEFLPMLGIYVTVSMVLNAASLIINVVILSLHHHNAEHPVPHWLRFLVFNVLCRVVCLSQYASERKEDVVHNKGEGIITGRAAPMEITAVADNEKTSYRNELVIPEDIAESIRKLMKSKIKNKTQDRNRSDWHLVARAFDRLFLIVYTVVIVAATLGFTVNSQNAYISGNPIA